MGQCGGKWWNRLEESGDEMVRMAEPILKERPTVTIEELVRLLIKLKYDLIEEDCARREILRAIQELLEKLLVDGAL